MKVATPNAEMSEKTLTQLVVGTNSNPGLARTFGFACYHTLRSKGSQPGFPDWTLARERVVFLELKTETGKVSDYQKEWLTAFNAAAVEAYVVRPRHFDAIACVLRVRGPIATWGTEARVARGELLVELDKHIERRSS
tara:strand:- start:207 stop:620 length:414 start_codon:yes stop_codon:yes gene_type:complete